MSISGKEETGSFNWQSTNYSSGIPIKKRKFLLFRSPSPESQELPNISSGEANICSPSRELSSLNVDNEASNASKSPVSNIDEAITAETHVNLAGPSRELSSLNVDNEASNASKSPVSNIDEAITAETHVNLAGPSCELSSLNVDNEASNARKSPVSNIDEATHVNLAGLNNKLSGVSQAPILTIPLDSSDTKEKLFLCGQQNITGDSKLDSAQVEVPIETTRKNFSGSLQTGKDCTPELFRKPGSTELSLGPEEPLISVSITDPDSKGGNQIPDKLDPSTLCLSLSQNNSASGYEVEDSMVNNAGTHVHAKRSNWDLNTPMDAWEGPSGDCDSLITVMNPCRMREVEPMISAVPKFVSDAREQFFGVTHRISDSPTSSHVDKYRSDDSLQLSLSTSAPTDFSVKQSNVSAQVNSGIYLPNSELVEGLVSTRSTSSAGCDTVKSEPFDENGKDANLGFRSISVNLPDQVNNGLVEKSITKAVNSPNVSLKNVSDPMPIKSEPIQEGKEEQIISHTSVEKVILCQENVSLSLRTAGQPNESFPLGLFACSKLAVSEDVPNQSDNTARMEAEPREGKDKTQVSCTLVDQAATGMLFPSLGHDSKESNTSDGMIYTGSTDDANVDKPGKSRLEAEDVFTSTNKNSDVFESDEENKNILTDILEEDAYRSDSGSEGNHEALVNLKPKHDGKEDEYEDGEVREALMHVEADVAMDDMEKDIINRDASDCTNAPAPDINDSKIEDHEEISDTHVQETADVLQKVTDEATYRDYSLQESSTVEETADRNDEKRPKRTTGRSPPVISGGTDEQEGPDMEELSDGATGRSRDNGITVSQIAAVGMEGTDTFEKVDPTLPNTESYLSDKNSGKDTNTAEADKDGNSGGSRSRIINLSRASNVTSPCEPRFMFTRPLLATERDRHTDFEEDRVPLQRNRSEFYADVPQNFDDDRFHDRSFRNSGTNFVRGRGRGRGFRQHVEWDSDRNFGADMNYNSGSYRFSKYKCAGGDDAEFEGNGYGIATSSRSSGIGRGGNSYRHPYSRRLSPGATYGTGTRGTQMLRRFPGNANSSRSIGEHNPDFVGPRNGGKYTRGLPKDVHDPTYDHPRNVNEGVDDQFVGGSRNFSTTVQRRGPRRIRSKSPVSSRTRSPGQWPSPRRRSSDNLIGLQELNHRRSPTTYRMDRIRSPDRPCFPEEPMGRRGGSPPYVARPSHDSRNLESGSANPNRRRPYDRVVPESTRRINITDPRERRDGEFFRGPNYSGRYNEFSGEGRGDERRKYGERRGRGRSFRPSFSGADGDNLRFHENGNRTFCPEEDSKHIERGDLREREFDRRINYKTGIASSRTRNLEEGGNRRGQVWDDDGFDDVPEIKRRKF